MPLTNELRKSPLQRAVNERLQRLTTRQLRELSVRREIDDAPDQLQQNWQRIVAGINYDAELKQFREGLRTMTEVLQTLTRLGEALSRSARRACRHPLGSEALSLWRRLVISSCKAFRPMVCFKLWPIPAT